MCGDVDSRQARTYQIGGAELKDLLTGSCKIDEAADKGPTKFLGWYENQTYIKKLENVPADYFKDLHLYAKLEQARHFDYSTGKWTFTEE